MKIVSILLLCILFLVSLTSGQDNSTETDDDTSTTIAEDCASFDNCFDCFVYGGGRCGYCQTAPTGPYGCMDMNENNRPSNTSFCTGEGAVFVSDGRSCPDNCRGHDTNRCEQCLRRPDCGFCIDGGGCVSANPSDPASAPWFYSIPGGSRRNCEDYRYTNPDHPVGRMCTEYESCSLNSGRCDSCVGTWEAYESGCVYCGSEHGAQCISASSNCSSVNLPETARSIEQCPSNTYNSAIRVAISLVTLSCIIMALMM